MRPLSCVLSCPDRSPHTHLASPRPARRARRQRDPGQRDHHQRPGGCARRLRRRWRLRRPLGVRRRGRKSARRHVALDRLFGRAGGWRIRRQQLYDGRSDHSGTCGRRVGRIRGGVQQSSGAPTDATQSIQLRLFDSSGLAVGDDFQVNTTTSLAQTRPSIARTASGSTGAPVGDDFQLSTYTSGDQRTPSVASSPAGEFLIASDSDGSSGSDVDGTSVQARRFAVDDDEDGPTNAMTAIRPTPAPPSSKTASSRAIRPLGRPP